jgi:hypothetical protein
MLSLLHLQEATDRLELEQERRIQQMSQQQLAGATIDDDQKKHYTEFQTEVRKLLRNSATWKALEPDYVKLYSDTYTETEIDGILLFYRSPAGLAMLAKSPELTEKSLAISKRRMDELAPKIQQLVDKFMLEAQ